MSNPIPLETVKFSPLLVSKILLTVMRHFFSQTPMPELRWDPDPKKSRIVIDTVNNVINQDDEYQKKPRVLINRGAYYINKVALTGDLAESKTAGELLGARHSQHINFVQGGFSIVIEAGEEGTCELMADMVSTFLTWSSDHVCNMYRFKQFGYPMTVQECSLDSEDKEKFKIVVSTGYLTESLWELREDAIKLKGLFTSIERTPSSKSDLLTDIL